MRLIRNLIKIVFTILLVAIVGCGSSSDTSEKQDKVDNSNKADDITEEEGICPQELQDWLVSCTWDFFQEGLSFSMNEEPQEYLEYCSNHEEMYEYYVCEEGDDPWCKEGPEYYYQEIVPVCRQEIGPLVFFYLYVEDANADIDDDMHWGWDLNDDDIPYHEEVYFAPTLPDSGEDADFSFGVGEDGSVWIEYSYGDYDVSASAQMVLPVSEGKISAPAGTYILRLSGGDHASGAWGISAEMRLWIVR